MFSLVPIGRNRLRFGSSQFCIKGAKLLLLLFTLVVFLTSAAVTKRVEAQAYPWCAIYSQGDGDGSCRPGTSDQCIATVSGQTNCGFVTWEQCMATVSGAGGFCAPNTQYQPTAIAPMRRR
jgi:hypothetical protein